MNTKLDRDLQFEVGQAERHRVDFHWRQFGGSVRAEVDGEEVLRRRHLFGLRSVRRYEFWTGNSERHHVVVEKHRSAPFAGFRPQTFRVLVDDAVISDG